MKRLAVGCICALGLGVMTVTVVSGRQSPPQFGGVYPELDARRQQLVQDWVARFIKTTGQQVEPGAYYDDVLSVSARTTFEAVTLALMRIDMTNESSSSNAATRPLAT